MIFLGHSLASSYISNMAHDIGVPIKFDGITFEGEYGHFAHMLIDVDLSKPLADTIMVKIDNNFLFLMLYFKSVPKFCTTGGSIQHVITSCHYVIGNPNVPSEAKNNNLIRGRLHGHREYWSKEN